MARKKVENAYVVEFPNEELKKDLKIICTLEGISMKQFILDAIQEKMIKVKEKRWESEF